MNERTGEGEEAFRSPERVRGRRSGHRNFAALAVVLLAGLPAAALSPHELALIVNTNHAESVEIAKFYAAARSIPEVNIVRLGLGENPGLYLSTNDFTRRIWEPVERALKERGVDGHIEAWIYSAGFPTAVRTPLEMSLTGLTFTRNRIPPQEAIKAGAVVSSLFSGPDQGATARMVSGGFERHKFRRDLRPPLPSMMLGVTGRHGNTVEEIKAMIRRGVESDAARPEGPVWFVSAADIRWTCREWQIAPVLAEMKQRGIPARMASALPAARGASAGVFTGTAKPKTAAVEAFTPGAVADHLTSFAGFFGDTDQVRLSAWIRQGATASSGTVTEPFAIWTKFPHARIFLHQRAGLSVIESYYLSVKCPMQLLIVGEPLASPYAPDISFGFAARETPEGVALAFTDVRGPSPLRFRALVNGRPAGRDRATTENWVIPRSALPAGEVEITGIVMREVPSRFSRQRSVKLRLAPGT